MHVNNPALVVLRFPAVPEDAVCQSARHGDECKGKRQLRPCQNEEIYRDVNISDTDDEKPLRIYFHVSPFRSHFFFEFVKIMNRFQADFKDFPHID